MGGYNEPPWGAQHHERVDHNNGMNICFADGHVKWYSLQTIESDRSIFGS